MTKNMKAEPASNFGAATYIGLETTTLKPEVTKGMAVWYHENWWLFWPEGNKGYFSLLRDELRFV